MTQEDIDTILTFDENIRYLIVKAIMARSIDVARAKCLGGYRDAVQHVIVQILIHPPSLTIACGKLTYLYNATRWAMYKVDRNKFKQRDVELAGLGLQFEQPALLEIEVRYAHDTAWLVSVIKDLLTVSETKYETGSRSREIDARDICLIKQYYGIGMLGNPNFDCIANEMGLTRERVRQLHLRTIERLRTKADSLLHDCEGYLDACGVSATVSKEDEVSA